MFVGNISQYEKEKRFLPEYIRPWIENVSRQSDLNPLTPATFDTVNYMNVDVTETAPASQRLMEAHRDYIDVQYILEGEENIGWQPLCQAGPVVDSGRGRQRYPVLMRCRRRYGHCHDAGNVCHFHAG